MAEPDERRLKNDLESASFLTGAVSGDWGHVPDAAGVEWPNVLFWVAAAPRPCAPTRYYVRLNCRNYPLDPPTGTFWDPDLKADLPLDRRPVGTGEVGRVFRTDWKGARAFYHPYDRTASRDGHADWPKKYPHTVWTETRTISDLLSVLHELLHRKEYEGVRSRGG